MGSFVFHFIENHHKNKCALIYYGRSGLGVLQEIFNLEPTGKYTQINKVLECMSRVSL